MANILTAINSIVNFKQNNLRAYSATSLNRINAVGQQLEFYIKDALADSFRLKQKQKEAAYSQKFSYLGNQNNPPDVILKGGDAFEVKKIEGLKSSLALNSSPPKDRLYSTDQRITEACKNCESWSQKELFYVVGSAPKGKIRYLFFVHGSCYSADKAVYEKLHSQLKQEISTALTSNSIEGADTIELGKVKRVDPLGITELRIRGMWSINNPITVFSEWCKLEDDAFSLFVLMTEAQYLTYPKKDRLEVEKNKWLSISEISIKDPNNPAKRVRAKLITSSW